MTTLEDDREIRDVLHRYCRGVDRLQLDLVAACFWPDATDDHGSFSGTVDELVAWLARLLPRYDVTTHALGNILIESHPTDPDRARVESYGVADHQTVGGPDTGNLTIAFRYLDRFERRDGRWRIATRVCTTEWVRVVPAATIRPVDERFLRGRRDGTDPVFDPWDPTPPDR